MIVVAGVEYEAVPIPVEYGCERCAAYANTSLCKALPDCLIGNKSVVFVKAGKAETPQQTYNRVMQEDNV